MLAALPMAARTLRIVLALLLLPAVPAAVAQQVPPKSAASPAATADQLAFFESKVRPVLAEHCYKCHSARADKLKANLRLDDRDAILQGGDSGPAITPGDPEKSLLVAAVRYHDEDLQMPPKGKLPDAAVADIVTWVRVNAPWPPGLAAPSAGGALARDSTGYGELRKSHWAYQPVSAPAVPKVTQATWPRDPIDHFTLAALERRGLKPAGDADRLTLARRLYFDLTGLPPTPAEIDAYLADASPGATAALVDRLLASPHFGERWGRHWLDVARYADSTGGGRSQILEEAWRYRDYVVAAFNADKPFDRFASEQIAGDLFASTSSEQQREQIIATGFLALGPKNLDAQDKDLLRMDVVDEQLDTIGRAFLGLSIGCARCHDHKFDPIPTAEYYSLAGILRSTKVLLPGNVSGFVRRPLPGLDPHAEQRKEHEQLVQSAQKRLEQARAELKKLSPVGVTVAATGPVDAPKLAGVVVDDTAAKTVGMWKHSTFHKAYVGSGYLHDDNADKGQKSIEFFGSLPAAGTYEVRISYTPGDGRAANVPVTVVHAAGETTTRLDQRKAPPIDGRFASLGTFRFDADDGTGRVTVSNAGTKGHVTVDAVQFVPVPVVPSGAVAAPAEGAKPQAAVAELAGKVKQLEGELAQLKKASPPPPPMALAVQEEDPKEIADCRINIRGNNHNLGPVAPRGFLSVATVSSPPRVDPKQSGRRELADWLTRADNPLTARVYVNRVWHHLFGAGLVRTPDDFGVTGEAPGHPELLDHLATSFVRDGWSTKKLIRRIVLSRTYQLSSASDAGSLAADPENRLLWRMNRRRLDAESLRDAVLLASGRLDLAVGGPTVEPSASEFEYKFDTVRRSVYIPVFRYTPHELMEAFDFPDPNLVAGRRSTSILATQALFLMNSPFMIEQSRRAAERLLGRPEVDDGARVDLAYRQTLGRPPTARERELAVKHVGEGSTNGDRVDSFAGLYQALFASIDFRYLN